MKRVRWNCVGQGLPVLPSDAQASNKYYFIVANKLNLWSIFAMIIYSHPPCNNRNHYLEYYNNKSPIPAIQIGSVHDRKEDIITIS